MPLPVELALDADALVAEDAIPPPLPALLVVDAAVTPPAPPSFDGSPPAPPAPTLAAVEKVTLLELVAWHAATSSPTHASESHARIHQLNHSSRPSDSRGLAGT